MGLRKTALQRKQPHPTALTKIEEQHQMEGKEVKTKVYVRIVGREGRVNFAIKHLV